MLFFQMLYCCIRTKAAFLLLWSEQMNRQKLINFVDFVLIIQFVLVGGSGFIMYINHGSAVPLLSLIHGKAGILLLVFLAVHIMLNWRWISFTLKKYYQRGKEVKDGEVIEANYIPID
jgi:hypothetical protein